MRVETPFHPMDYSKIPAGMFFKALRNGDNFFGLKVVRKDSTVAAAMIFRKMETQIGVPSIANGDFNDAFVAMPDAVLRPDLKSATASDSSFPFGVLIATENGPLMKASDGFGGTAFFDIETGQQKSLPETRPLLIYPRWAVGHIISEVFESLFNFPPPTSSSGPINI